MIYEVLFVFRFTNCTFQKIISLEICVAYIAKIECFLLLCVCVYLPFSFRSVVCKYCQVNADARCVICMDQF